MGARAIRRKQVIIPTGEKADWLRARKLVEDKGGLPHHSFLDDVIVRPEAGMYLNPAYHTAWSRHLLAHPEKGGRFARGHEVVDSYGDGKGREWTLHSSSVPEEALGREGVGLFIDPKHIEVDDKRVVVYAEPESIGILAPFIQTNNQAGKVDESSRVPLGADPQMVLTAIQSRVLRRIDGVGVRPIARVLDNAYGRIIYANYRHDAHLKVAYAGPDTRTGSEDTLRMEVAQAPLNGIMVHGVTLTQFRAMLGDAHTDLAKAVERHGAEGLEAIMKLVHSLGINE